jgi:hypothetical protein
LSDRLPANVEASALIRRAAAEGDFATVLRKGDPDRGALLLTILERGRLVALLERTLSADFTYRWSRAVSASGDNESEIAETVNKRLRADPDSWLIELDIADAERFIAETIVSG